MSRRTSDLHADWLRLVEPEGQFLSLPVLRRAFPDGLDTVSPVIREEIRDRYPHDIAPSQDQWDAWIDWLTRDALAWGPYYRTGEDAAAYTHALPERGIVLRADAALCDPESGKLRVLVMRYPHGTPLERRLAGERWNTSPLDRLTLLCRAQGVRIGLVTDGERIVLAWVPSAGAGGYATWETALFTESRERNLLQSLVSLLHASRFFAVRVDKQLESLFEASEKAQNEVTGQLGLQVRQAVELLVAALSRADLERGGALLASVAPPTVYQAAATVMMRLIFLLYAEERDLLPLADPFYAEYYAASTLREQLDEQAAMEGDEPLERRGAAWFRLLALFRVIYGGVNHDRLRLLPYGGRLFDPDRFAFLEGRGVGESWSSDPSRPLPVDDLTVRAILEAIQTLPIRESGSKERRRLSFRSLDVEQIGHVYEGLLDHGAERVHDVYVGLVGKIGDEAEIPLVDLERAAAQGQQPLVSFLHDFTGKSESAIEKLIERGRAVADGKDSEARRLVNTVCDNNAALANRVAPFVYALGTDLHGLPVVFPPESLVVKQTRVRRESGTEYTPRALAEEIVRFALEPLVYSPGPRDGLEPEQWRLRPSKELLNLKICDPAVGSGAFLVSACRYLSDRVVEAWILEDAERARASGNDLTLEARRAVVDQCLYGVDRDGMAVEMAKLSLWLITMARERPFCFLDHAIRVGDSLVGITSLDQLRYLHIDPNAGRAVHMKTHIDVTEAVTPLLGKASDLRQELESITSVSVRDSEEKQRLNAEANRLLYPLSIIADSVVATALSTAAESEHRRNTAFQGLASLVASALDESQPAAKRLDALERLHSRNNQLLNAGRPEGAPPRSTFHWALAFPEVFNQESRRGFDALIGNPPFLGAKKIGLSFGYDFREFLVQDIAFGRKGNADLVIYFVLRATQLAQRIAALTTNTASQGDSREVGFDWLCANGWTIVRAEKNRRWPGKAGIEISQIWATSEHTLEARILDGKPQREISSMLLPAGRISGPAHGLKMNEGLAFVGAYPLGSGFSMTGEAAQMLIERNPKNKEVLFPYINGKDLCSRPDLSGSRWIVNFGQRSLEESAKYIDCFRMVSELVKPERELKKQPAYVKYWWRYAHTATVLYEAIGELNRVIALPLTGRAMTPIIASLKPLPVLDQTIVVFATDDWNLFGLLSSEIHRLWVYKYGATLRGDQRYVPSDCFVNFPRPETYHKRCGELAATLQEVRSRIMLDEGLGLTALYNRFHNANDNKPQIRQLRDLHRELDRVVADSYGWRDLDFHHGYNVTPVGTRYTLATDEQFEILERLLALNHERHREEVRLGLVAEVQLDLDKEEMRGRKSSSSSSSAALSLLTNRAS
jgi:hypothetical protein